MKIKLSLLRRLVNEARAKRVQPINENIVDRKKLRQMIKEEFNARGNKQTKLMKEAFDRPHGPGDPINYDQVLLEIYKAGSVNALITSLHEQRFTGIEQFIDNIKEITEQNTALISGKLRRSPIGENSLFTIDLHTGELHLGKGEGTDW